MAEVSVPKSAPLGTSPSVLRLYGLRDSPISEDDAKSLFDSYASVPGAQTLRLEEIRVFLGDLMQANGYPPFVSEHSLDLALKEMQLDGDGSEDLSWPDFKSFFVYLVSSPLKHLWNVIMDPLKEIGINFDRAVWVTGLPKQLFLDDFNKAFASVCGGSFLASFTCLSKNQESSIAIVFFTDENSVLNAVAASGCLLFDREITISKYRNQQFPIPLPSRRSSMEIKPVAKAIAVTVVGAKNLTHDIDEKLKISSTLKTFDNDHKVSETFVSTSILVANKTVAAAKEIDESLKISETMTGLAKKTDETLKITAGVSAAKEAMLANESIRKGLGAVSGFFSRVSDSFSDFSEQTRVAIKEEQAKKIPVAPIPVTEVAPPAFGVDDVQVVKQEEEEIAGMDGGDNVQGKI
jgi:hypothetical protein